MASTFAKSRLLMRKAAQSAATAKIFTKMATAEIQAADLVTVSKRALPSHLQAGGFGKITAPATLTPFTNTAGLPPQRMGELRFFASNTSYSISTKSPQQVGHLDGRLFPHSSSVAVAAFSSATAKGAVQAQPLDVTSKVPNSVPPVHSNQSPSVDPEEPVLYEMKSGSDADASASYWRIETRPKTREDGTPWPWKSFRPVDAYSATELPLDKHFKPTDFGDVFAKYLVKALRIPTDLFFRKRYGCRAMMLETVAAVPGMSAGMLLHLKSLRLIEHSGGWIRALLEEAENERMHLMTFMQVSKPKWYERALIFSVQAVFFTAYTTAYIISPRVAHRVVGYLEEEAIHSYTQFLEEIDAGRIENVPAPAIAIDYWRLPKDARLREVVVAVRADEAHHRDVNHYAASVVAEGEKLKDHPAPLDYH